MSHIKPHLSSKAYWAAEDDYIRRWKDDSFRRGEKEAIRRERNHLIKLGVITPAYRMPPQLMVRNPDVLGGWSPEIKCHG